MASSNGRMLQKLYRLGKL